MTIEEKADFLRKEARTKLACGEQFPNLLIAYSDKQSIQCGVDIGGEEDKRNFILATKVFFRLHDIHSYIYVVNGFSLHAEQVTPQEFNEILETGKISHLQQTNNCIVIGTITKEKKDMVAIVYRQLSTGKIEVLKEEKHNVKEDLAGIFNTLLEE